MNIELIIDLTDEQKQSMQENSVTNKMFNKRINQGWSIKEIIGLPRTFKQADNGLIYKQLRVRGKLYHLSSDDYFYLKEIGVELNRVYSRIGDGEPFDIAIKRKVRENMEDMNERLYIEELNKNQRIEKEKKQKERKAKRIAREKQKAKKVKFSQYWTATYKQMMKQF